MSLHRYLSLGLACALLLAACALASPSTSPTSASTNAPTIGAPAGATDTPGAGGQTTQGAPVAVSTGKPPQSTAAEIRPPERRAELTRLSNLLQFQVMGQNNAALGKISDYIVNTCETYIVYFVVDPSSDLQLAAGSKLVIPFEAVTINSGALDAQAKAIVVQLSPAVLKAAPAASGTPKLLPTDWEDAVRTYWQQVVRVGKLSTVCNTGSGSTQKIAYATQLIGANLKDGNGNVLGAVQDGILEPESGKLGFYVIAGNGNQGLMLVPLAKTNIPPEALQPGARTELVLLADPSKLAGAPHLSSPDQATDAGAQSAARGYWGQ